MPDSAEPDKPETRVAMLLTAAAVVIAGVVLAFVAVVRFSALQSAILAAALGWVLVAIAGIAALLLQRRISKDYATLADRQRKLLADRDEVEATGFARARFIADMSHDLRQPLHALGLFVDALEKRVTPGEGEKTLAKAREASVMLTRAFNALIDFARIDAEALIPEVEQFALDDVLQRLADEIADSGEHHGVDLRLVDTRAAVVGDARLIGHLLRILVANAAELGPSRLLLGVRHRGGNPVVELHCSRPGELAAKWTNLGGGETGSNALELDLIVAKRLAELMNLGLRFSAKPDRGFVVALTLIAANQSGRLPLQGRSILVVADQHDYRVGAAVALARAGAVVHVTRNVRQAVDAARQTNCDLLVTAIGGEAARDAADQMLLRALTDRTPLDHLAQDAEAKLNEP